MMSSSLPEDVSVAAPAPLTMRSAPRATVVVPVLDNRDYLAASLHALLRQWSPDLELLVIDDGSTDGSFSVAREVLASYPDVASTLLRNEVPLGMGGLPLLLRHAAAPIIIQADSDDVALPGRLAATLECFDTDPECRLVTSNAVLLSSEGVPFGLFDLAYPNSTVDDPMRAASLTGCRTWLGATSAYHRTLLEAFPPLDPAICPYGLDLLLAFRATLVGSHHYLAQPLIGWRQHGRNTHRLAGAHTVEDLAFEKHGALELMALAQKIRDVAAVQAGLADPSGLDAVAARCRQTFLEHFVEWSRIRNRVDRLQPGPTPGKARATTAMPPLTALRRGEPHLFGVAGTLGHLAASWPGVHAPEQEWNWTGRFALLAFTLARDGADTVTLRLSGLREHTPLFHVSVNFARPRQVELQADEVTVVIPIERAQWPDLLVVLINVPGAFTPNHSKESPDCRLLGIQLRSIEIT